MLVLHQQGPQPPLALLVNQLRFLHRHLCFLRQLQRECHTRLHLQLQRRQVQPRHHQRSIRKQRNLCQEALRM